MKRLILLLLPVFVLLSCATAPSGSIVSAEKSLKDWAYGLQEKNLESLMSAYWDEASITFITPDGEKSGAEGKDIITEIQKDGMNDPNPYNVRLDTAVHEITGNSDTYTVMVETSDIQLKNVLEFQEREGIWRIINQTVSF